VKAEPTSCLYVNQPRDLREGTACRQGYTSNHAQSAHLQFDIQVVLTRYIAACLHHCIPTRQNT
jgi:hypothetical protein